MAEPNMRLRAVRQTLRMSQADLARAVREAGARAGEPNGCTASQVRRWEGISPTAAYSSQIDLKANDTPSLLRVGTRGIRRTSVTRPVSLPR